MKQTIHLVTFFIFTCLSILILINVRLFPRLDHYHLLFFRNYSLFLMGVYYITSLKNNFNLFQSYSNNLVITSADRQEIFNKDYLHLLINPTIIGLFLTYSIFNIVAIIKNEGNISSIVIDFLLFSFSLSFFGWILVFLKSILIKEAHNILILVTVSIPTLNSLASLFDKNIYLLMNPFGGWIYALNIFNIHPIAKLFILFFTFFVVFFSCKKSTRNLIKWHV